MENKAELKSMLQDLITKVENDEVKGIIVGSLLTDGKINSLISGKIYNYVFESIGMLEWIKARLLNGLRDD